MSRKILTVLAASILVGVLGFTPTPASAIIETFNTPGGATESGGSPVDAQVVFTTSANTITVQLTNLLANPTTVAQLLSDLSFQITTGQTSGSLTSSSGQEITVHSNGSFTTGATVSTGWALSTSGSVFTLDVLGTPTGPAHLIIGPPGGGGTYSNANGSIAGNGPHNPFLNGTATFTLTVPGVTSVSGISDVVFSFGTTPGDDVPVTPPSVPEPVTLLLVGLGLTGVAGAARWGRRRS